eukprot:scaffold13831_cov75-Phaeocystis_antarctica.AAC.5
MTWLSLRLRFLLPSRVAERALTPWLSLLPPPQPVENSATMQTLRCPLCCVQFELSSEAECIAHMETCSAFHAEYGQGARRAGLVSGMEALPAAVAAAPGSSRELPPVTLRSACEGFADALLPLVPLQRTKGGTAEEAVAFVARLAAALFDAVHEAGPEFDVDDLFEVTFDSLLTLLEAEQASGVRSGVVAALNALQRAASTDGAPAQLPSASGEVYSALCERLLSGMESFRHCGHCGKSGCKLFACTACKGAVRYCGQSCQRTAWAVHKLVCSPHPHRAQR